MYKVFFNDSFLKISNKSTSEKITDKNIVPYQNLSQIHDWLSKVENINKPLNITLLHDQPRVIWKKFKTLFNVIEAAGGLIKNNNNKYLFIYRRGKWDLPKGKINKGETPYDTAIREVHEETGLNCVRIINEINKTYHIYRLKDRLVLKKTYWFLMLNEGTDDITIQTEEDIEKAFWFDEKCLNNILNDSYESLKDVYNTHFSITI